MDGHLATVPDAFRVMPESGARRSVILAGSGIPRRDAARSFMSVVHLLVAL
jgi:hypothetical protein